MNAVINTELEFTTHFVVLSRRAGHIITLIFRSFELNNSGFLSETSVLNRLQGMFVLFKFIAESLRTVDNSAERMSVLEIIRSFAEEVLYDSADLYSLQR